MNNMFYDCLSLSFLPDIPNLNNSNVIDMEHMFNIIYQYHFYLIFQIGILLMILI